MIAPWAPRSGGRLLIALALASAVAAAATPTPSTTPPAGAAEVRVVSQAARWTGLLPMDGLADDSESMFLISGEVENRGPAPVTSIKLGYELLADTGDGEVVLASEYGYNFRAEGLRSPAVESGEIPPTMVPVRPLAAGEKDLFRMVFFRADVPRFDRWRVHILEVR
jgi:hypothetical protein